MTVSTASKSSSIFEFSSSSPSTGSALLQHVPDQHVPDLSVMKSLPSTLLKVIPDEDPQRAVETTSNQPDDYYSGMMQDGLGDDGDGLIDDDKLYDAGTTSNTQERFALPPWLAEAFKARVEEANNRGGDNLPKLYLCRRHSGSLKSHHSFC